MGHPPGPFTSMNDGFPMIHWVYPCNVSSFYRYEGIIMVFIHLGLLSGWWFGTFFFHSVGNVIIPTDELTPSFSEG